jgi:uncharacterized membrane protein YkoI
MSRNLMSLAVLLVAPSLAIAAPADAKGPVSKHKATRAALAEYPGTIVSSKTQVVDGQTTYIFTIAAPNQPAQQVRVSGDTGKVL